MNGISTQGKPWTQEALPLIPPQGVGYYTVRSRHSLGNGTMVMAVLLSLRLEINFESIGITQKGEEAMDILREAWSHREGPIVFTTVDTEGVPNSIYATCTEMNEASNIVIADNYFEKHLIPNIQSTPNISKRITNTEKKIPEILRFHLPVGGTNGIIGH